ncbi:putative ABC transport system permease protein [Rathayibacter oskolensis]|uniref:Putative ABC transport system permease protein n=1 Tax=Rathayibacter oskolensis TaxID=1891671 RepID=A0A1X7P0U0_9MICO|nr:FtsX-like permease family protein [Rathayibacter oskolensis]SMH44247.1 putative ABC transport system permease protein [Rathayibacter oskolensis]
MLTLLRSDLLGDLRLWWGTFFVLVAAGAVAGVPTTLIETALNEEGFLRLGILAVASTALVLATVSLVLVLSSTVRTLVELRRRTFALWLVVGMQPAQVAVIVVCEVALVASAGAGVGAAVAYGLCPSLVGILLEGSSGLQDVRPVLSPGSALLGGLVAVVVAVLAALPLAREAGSTPVLSLLRGEQPRRVRVVRRAILAVLLVAVAGSMYAGLPGALPSGAAQSVLLGPVLIAAAATAAPVYMPALIRLWTSVIPARVSVAWFLARETVITSAQRSSAAVVAFLVAIGLPWTFLVGQQTVASAVSGAGSAVDPRPLALLLGGPALLAAIGAAAGLLMASSNREREDALLEAAGADDSARTLTSAWEALIYVVTAGIVAGIVAVAVGGGATLFLVAVAPAVRPALVPGVAVGATLVCLLLGWIATFAPRLGRTRAIVEVLGES